MEIMNNYYKQKIEKNKKNIEIIFFLIFVPIIVLTDNILGNFLIPFILIAWMGIFIYSVFVMDYNYSTLNDKRYFFFKKINLFFGVLFFFISTYSEFDSEFKIKHISDTFIPFFLFCSLILHFFFTTKSKLFLTISFLKYFIIFLIFYVFSGLSGYITDFKNFIISLLPIKISGDSVVNIIDFYVFLMSYIVYIFFLWNINYKRYRNKYCNYLKICISVFNIIAMCLPIKLVYIAIYKPKIYLTKDLNIISSFFSFYIAMIVIIIFFQIYILCFHEKVIKKILD